LGFDPARLLMEGGAQSQRTKMHFGALPAQTSIFRPTVRRNPMSCSCYPRSWRSA